MRAQAPPLRRPDAGGDGVRQVSARRRAGGRAGLLGLVAVLAGCAGTQTSAPVASTSAAPSASAGASDEAAATAQYDSGVPPASAQMVCGDEIRRLIAGALDLGAAPVGKSTWADHVYTCTYSLPMGRLPLSVTVTPSRTAARGELETGRAEFAAADAEPGLGEQAYSSADGTVLAVKDNMVLHVDATGLPDDLGPAHQRRIDFARVIAAGIMSCWTGG